MCPRTHSRRFYESPNLYSVLQLACTESSHCITYQTLYSQNAGHHGLPNLRTITSTLRCATAHGPEATHHLCVYIICLGTRSLIRCTSVLSSDLFIHDYIQGFRCISTSSMIHSLCLRVRLYPLTWNTTFTYTHLTFTSCPQRCNT